MTTSGSRGYLTVWSQQDVMYEQDAQALGLLQQGEVEIHGCMYMSIANLL